MNDDPLDVRKLAIELAAIAQNGLAYSRDHFDIERFQRLAVLAEQLLVRDDLGSYRPAPALTAGYATPKVDVRAGVFDEDGRVLLVQEVADGRWSLPGGWCDVSEFPRGDRAGGRRKRNDGERDPPRRRHRSRIVAPCSGV